MSGANAVTKTAEEIAADMNLPMIEFATPMPGFPRHRKFLLVRPVDDGDVFVLTSLDDPDIRFLVVPPYPFFPDYTPEIDDETMSALGASDPTNLLVLLVVTTADKPTEATVNLFAPIIVDQTTRRAVQCVLNNTELPIRAKLMAAAA